LGAAWEDQWVDQLVEEPQSLLPIVLTEGLEAARMRGPGVLQALQAFLSTESWTDARRLVEAHPELLGGEADRLLTRLIGLAAARGANAKAGELKLHAR